MKLNARIRAFLPVLAAVLLAGGLSVAPMRAQPAPSDAGDAPTEGDAAALRSSAAAPGAVFLVRRPQHVRASIKTAGDLQASEELAGMPVEVVICGKAVQNLSSEGELAEPIREAEAGSNISFFACGMSMKNLGVERGAVMPEIEVVPNGLVYTLERQAEGYLSVDL